MEPEVEPMEILKSKCETLYKGFSDMGLNMSSEIDKYQLISYLNKRSKFGEFDKNLFDALCSQLGLNDYNKISVENFIDGFVQLDDAIFDNAIKFIKTKAHDTLIHNKLEEICRNYRTEKLNSEGLSDKAMVTIKITDVDISRKLEGIEGIIIRVVYNGEEQKIIFNLGGGETHLNEMMKFRPLSRNDQFEFIMEGINGRHQIFKIGSKVFQLQNIKSVEEYKVEITIPEINDYDNIVAHIFANIILYCSDFEAYERQRSRTKRKLLKTSDATFRACQYVKTMREIYGELAARKFGYIVIYNNDKYLDSLAKSLLIKFINERSIEVRSICEVEFNNLFERFVSSMLSIEFINEIERTINTYKYEDYDEEIAKKYSYSISTKEPQNSTIEKKEYFYKEININI